MTFTNEEFDTLATALVEVNQELKDANQDKRKLERAVELLETKGMIIPKFPEEIQEDIEQLESDRIIRIDSLCTYVLDNIQDIHLKFDYWESSDQGYHYYKLTPLKAIGRYKGDEAYNSRNVYRALNVKYHIEKNTQYKSTFFNAEDRPFEFQERLSFRREGRTTNFGLHMSQGIHFYIRDREYKHFRDIFELTTALRPFRDLTKILTEWGVEVTAPEWMLK